MSRTGIFPAVHRASTALWSKLALRRQLLRETRTRILFLYGLLLLLTAGVSIPIFRYFLFASVDQRVREDLIEEREAFIEAYEDWESTSNQTTQTLSREGGK